MIHDYHAYSPSHSLLSGPTCAHCGSTCVPSAHALSVDHKPNSKEERQRIENAGGVVVWAGTWRVGGVLAVSRAFGDRPLKRYVIATPEIKEETLKDEDEFLILASDGLWDVISNQVRLVPCVMIYLPGQGCCSTRTGLQQPLPEWGCSGAPSLLQALSMVVMCDCAALLCTSSLS